MHTKPYVAIASESVHGTDKRDLARRGSPGPSAGFSCSAPRDRAAETVEVEPPRLLLDAQAAGPFIPDLHGQEEQLLALALPAAPPLPAPDADIPSILGSRGLARSLVDDHAGL
nr:unnamed protein product [Digitaria exilis]